MFESAREGRFILLPDPLQSHLPARVNHKSLFHDLAGCGNTNKGPQQGGQPYRHAVRKPGSGEALDEDDRHRLVFSAFAL